VPAGASITSGQGTNQITVTFSTTSGNVSVTETSGTCKVGPLNLYVSVGGTTGINQEETSNNNILVYPNPGKGLVNIQSQKILQTIKVTNLLGQVICDKQVNAKQCTVDISVFPAGVYLLYVTEEAKAPVIRKIVVE
jgi:hypothetical protein